MAIHANSTLVPGRPLLRGGDAPGRLLSTEELLALLGSREHVEQAIETLIEALDARDPDPDLEPAALEHHGLGFVQSGGDDAEDGHDREAVNEDGDPLDQGEHDTSDLEPWLGTPESGAPSQGMDNTSGTLEEDGWRKPRRQRVRYPEDQGTLAYQASQALEVITKRKRKHKLPESNLVRSGRA